MAESWGRWVLAGHEDTAEGRGQGMMTGTGCGRGLGTLGTGTAQETWQRVGVPGCWHRDMAESWGPLALAGHGDTAEGRGQGMTGDTAEGWGQG